MQVLSSLSGMEKTKAFHCAGAFSTAIKGTTSLLVLDLIKT
jgi:hypothetical protein